MGEERKEVENVRIGTEGELELTKAVMKASIDRDNLVGAVSFTVLQTKDGTELEMQGWLPSDLSGIARFCEEVIVNLSNLAIQSMMQAGERAVADHAQHGHPVLRKLLAEHGNLPPEILEEAHKAMSKMTYLKVFQKAGNRIFKGMEGDGDEDGEECDCDSCNADNDTPTSSKDR